ncbi:MAG: hypothetical protein ACYC28_15335 [Longimicrobiales bacterium]
MYVTTIKVSRLVTLFGGSSDGASSARTMHLVSDDGERYYEVRRLPGSRAEAQAMLDAMLTGTLPMALDRSVVHAVSQPHRLD